MAGQADLVVLGGGPAGAVAAWLAARDGARVVLIDPDRAPSRIEGLSPRLADWLLRSGLGCPSLGRVSRRSHWAGTSHADNHEILVARPDLDRHLRDCARAAGAELVVDIATPGRGGARLASGRRIEAALVLDARGRRGAGREGTRRGPATIAIGGWLDGPPDSPAQSMVVPFDEGWLWFAGSGGGRAWVQVTLDAAEGTGAPPARRLARALSCCADRLPAGFRADGALPVVRECSPVLSPLPDDLSVLPIGDAAAAMDPLSGHGMFWAVSAALAADAVRRTLAVGPDRKGRDLARRFLVQRGQDIFLRQARIGRDFIRAETGRAALRFWRARAGFPDDAPAHDGAAAVTTRRQVVVRDRRLAEAEVLVSPRSPGGVAWFLGLPAADLWRAHAAGEDPGRLVQRFGPRAAGFPDWLAQEGIPA